MLDTECICSLVKKKRKKKELVGCVPFCYAVKYTTQKNLRVRRYFRHYFLNVNYIS